MADPQGSGGLVTPDGGVPFEPAPVAAVAPAKAPEPSTGKAPHGRGWWNLAACALIVGVVGAAWTVGQRKPPVVVAAHRTNAGAVLPAAGRAASSAGIEAPLDVPLTGAAALAHAASTQPATFDARLLDAYARFADGEADAAVAAARRLAEGTPSSGLAQIVYADLLRLRAGAPPASGWGASAPSPGDMGSAPAQSNAVATAKLLPGSEVSQQTRLDELLAEARARIATAQPPTTTGALPSQFVQLAKGVGHVVAVDVARSRVYLLTAGPSGWAVTRDYYASVGKLGADKLTEGDLRTPLGVYFVTGTVQKGRLADRFGAAALTLNYPNQYDQLRGRTGNGIWLHGVPASLYARAPRATDGCVALANDDMTDLARHIDRQVTPVLIAPTLDWVPANRPDAAGDAFLATFARWRVAHATPDPGDELSFYSNTVRTPAAASGPAWEVQLHRERSDIRIGQRSATTAAWSPALSDVSVVGWHDERPVMVVTFRERDGPVAQARLRRQYWVEEAGHWHIIYEGDVG